MHGLLPALAFGLLLVAPCARLQGQRPAVLSVTIDGVIHPVTADILASAIAQAQTQHYQLIIIRLNTPGGFLDATRTITETLLASPVPVATWVGPAGARAASAGFFVLEASDIAVMAPGTRTGAAHPVMLVGTPDPVLLKKIENDTAASLRSVVARRGRNPEMAEKAVLESRSFTDSEAQSFALIDFVATDWNDLLQRLNGRELKRFDGTTLTLRLPHAGTVVYEPTLSQCAQLLTADPNLALGLLLLGGLLLYIEFSSPGLILPGVAGAILVLLGLSALSVLPVTWSGILLVGLAMVLFVLEVKITSHGVLAGGGLIAMVLGATLLVDSPVPELRIHLSTALSLAVPFAMIFLTLITLVIRVRRTRVQAGAESFVGQHAEALTALSPAGQVLFHGEVWNARATDGVEAGTPVRVISRQGLELEVEPAGPRVPSA